MKKYLLAVLLLASFQSFGQFLNYTNINGRYKWIAGKFDSTFTIPSGTTPSLRVGGGTGPGALFYRTTDSTVYQYTGTQWIKLRAGVSPTDTAGIWISNVYRQTGTDSVFYVKGGTSTFAFRDSIGNVGGGGGGGKIYYFNGGVNLGTFGGFTMYELGDTAVTSAAANFTRSTTGNLANFITDVNRPGLLQIPAGVWTVDAFLSETGGGANHAEIWIEVEKWDGSTITTIATSPIEQITNGNVIDLYTWAVSIPTTTLAVTDRIIIQFYITNTNGKTVTLYTQNGYVGEVHTTFTTGIGSLNGLTAPTQYFATGTSGTDFAISSSTATHTFNLPTASGSNRGALSSTDWTTFNSKVGGSGTTNYVSKWTGSTALGNSLIFDNGTNVGIGTASPSYLLDVNGTARVTGNTYLSTGSQTALNIGSSNFSGTLWASSSNVFIGSSAKIYGSTAADASIGSNLYFDGSVDRRIRAGFVSDIYFDTNGDINFRSAGTGSAGSTLTTTTNAVIKNNGNVGIGTTSPSYKLDVVGDIRSSTGTYLTSATVGTTQGFLYNGLGSTTFGVNTTGNALIVNDIDGAKFAFGTGGFNTTFYKHRSTDNKYYPTFVIKGNAASSYGTGFDFYVGTSIAMNLSSNSNLLIGTTTDAGYKLDVNGTTRISGTELRLDNGTTGVINLFSNTPEIRFSVGDPTNYRIYRSSTNMVINSAGAIIQQIGGNQAYTIDASNGHILRSAISGGAALARLTTGGNFLIGTTTDLGEKVYINAGSVVSMRIENSGTNASILIRNSTYPFVRFDRAGTVGRTLGIFNSNGDIAIQESATWSGSNYHIFYGFGGYATIGSGTFGDNVAANASAVLEAKSTTKGFLPPRMTNAQMVAIATPASGLVVYDTTNNKLNVYDGTNWVAVH